MIACGPQVLRLHAAARMQAHQAHFILILAITSPDPNGVVKVRFTIPDVTESWLRVHQACETMS